MGKSIINIVNRTQNYTNKTKHAAQKTEKMSNSAYAINTLLRWDKPSSLGILSVIKQFLTDNDVTLCLWCVD
jgi:hypothetical protein